jgi:hypothetical protein
LRLFRRSDGTEAPQPAAVLLASTGVPFGRASIERARELAGAEAVAVLSTARLYGFGLGLPNPGLMPSRKERDEQRAIVQAALDTLEGHNLPADGQVTVTRHPAATIVRAARLRRVRHVVLEVPRTGGLRRFVEGDPVAVVRRRLGASVSVHVVT